MNPNIDSVWYLEALRNDDGVWTLTEVATLPARSGKRAIVGQLKRMLGVDGLRSVITVHGKAHFMLSCVVDGVQLEGRATLED